MSSLSLLASIRGLVPGTYPSSSALHPYRDVEKVMAAEGKEEKRSATNFFVDSTFLGCALVMMLAS